VIIRVTKSSSRVDEASDLKRLSVQVDSDADIATDLGSLGTVDADGAHVWLIVDALRAAAAATVSDDVEAWRAGFDGMIAYAAKSGWTNPEVTSVRAHIEG
jgi:hypothetical protein